MAGILHLLTRREDALAAEIIARQKDTGRDIVVVDLTVEETDYPEIVKSIFRADSVQTW
jgi:hypothetical protein